MTSPLHPAQDLAALGSTPGFVPEWLPTANGAKEWVTQDPANAEVCRRFQAAYYAINRAHARLRAVREAPATPDQPQLERRALQEIECALRHRDELEDLHAPLGIIAEPVAREGFTVDLQFTFGSTDASGRYRSEPIVSTAEITFQVPADRGRGDLRPPGCTSSPSSPCAD